MPAPATRLSLPGKCFLFGEYAVLADGPALLLTFPPEFELRARAAAVAGKGMHPFHPESAAGRLWASDPASFADWDFEFHDPFAPAGGFGRSSAEFGTLFSFREESSGAPGNPTALAWKARQAFRDLHAGEKTPPSGADVLAQVVRRPPGVVLYVDLRRKLLQDLGGIPTEASLFLVHSGRKVPTHEHLEKFDLKQLQNLKELNEITEAAHLILSAHEFVKHDDRDRTLRLGDLLSRYGSSLADVGLVAPSAKRDLAAIQGIPGVLGAKGCGALGADAYAVLLFSSDRARFLRGLEDLGLNRIFDFREHRWLEKSE